MKPFWTAWAIAVCIIALSIGLPLHAATYHSFLRINKLYILYTDPIVPHADSQGNFWVGLRPFATLIGAKCKDKSSQSVTLVYRDHSLTFTNGSPFAMLDTIVLRLPAAVKKVGAMHEFVVPVSAIARAFGLHTEWDHRYRVLTFVDTKLYEQGTIEDWVGRIEQFEGPAPGYVQRVKLFVGPPYPVAPVIPVVLTQTGAHLVLRLHNTFPRSSRMYINTYQSGQSEEQIFVSGIPYPTSYPNPPVDYTIKAHGDLDFTVEVADSITNDPHDINPANPGIVTVIKHRHKVSAAAVRIVL